MARRSSAIFLIALLAAGCKSTAVNSSLDVKIGEATIQAAAVTPTAFRISVSYDGKPARLQYFSTRRIPRRCKRQPSRTANGAA